MLQPNRYLIIFGILENIFYVFFSPSASMASLFSKESTEEKAGNLNEMTFKPKLRTTGGFPTVDSQDMMIEESLFIQRMAPNGNKNDFKKYLFFLLSQSFFR